MGRYSLAIVGFDPAVVGMEPLTFLHVPWNTAAWGALFLALVALAWVLAALDAGCAAGVLGAHVPAFVGLGGLYALTHWQGSEYLGALLQMGALALLVPSLVVVGWRIFRARRFAFACAWPPALIALVCGVFITFAVDQWSLGGGLFCAGASAVVAAIPFILAGVLAGQSRRAGAGWLGFFLGLLASGIAGTVTAVLLSEDLRYLFIAGIMVGLALAWPVMAVRLALRRGGGWSRPLLFLTLSWGLAVGSILLFQDEIRFAGLCLLLAALAGMALYRLWRGARGLRAGLLGLTLGLAALALVQVGLSRHELDADLAALLLPLAVWLLPLFSLRPRWVRVAAWGLAGGALLCTALLAWYLASLPAGDREDVSSLPVVLGCLATLYLAMILGLVRWNRWAAAIAEGRPMRATPQEKPETVQVGIMLAAH